MSEKSQALRLINNLLADIREPDFIWQVAALIVCIGTALLIARWWRSRHAEGSRPHNTYRQTANRTSKDSQRRYRDKCDHQIGNHAQNCTVLHKAFQIDFISKFPIKCP